MKQNLITDVIQGMLPFLNNAQTERLQEVLQLSLIHISESGKSPLNRISTNFSFLTAFRALNISNFIKKHY